jgi:hypothetical protein
LAQAERASFGLQIGQKAGTEKIWHCFLMLSSARSFLSIDRIAVIAIGSELWSHEIEYAGAKAKLMFPLHFVNK